MPIEPAKEFRIALLPGLLPASGITATVADDSDTTLSLSDEGTITAGSQILVESELMYVSAVTSDSSDEATVIRGVDGTTAAAHTTASVQIVNLYTPRMPGGLTPNTEQIIMQMIPGGEDLGRTGTADRQSVPFNFWCYAATSEDAMELWRVLRSAALALQSTLTTGIKFLKVEVGNGTQLIDEDGEGPGWPYTLGLITVTFLSRS